MQYTVRYVPDLEMGSSAIYWVCTRSMDWFVYYLYRINGLVLLHYLYWIIVLLPAPNYQMMITCTV